MIKKNAFTLTEILIAISIISMIAGVVASQIGKIDADSIKESFRNDYSHLVSTVTEMYNDETLYPRVETSSKNDYGQTIYKGFCNMYSSGTMAQPYSNFVKNFVAKTDYYNKNNLDSNISTMIAKNNSFWTFYGSMFDYSASYCEKSTFYNDAYMRVLIDVNGPNKAPNCPYEYTGTGNNVNISDSGSNCTKPDIFKFLIYSDSTIKFDESTIYNNKNLYNYLDDNNYIKMK